MKGSVKSPLDELSLEIPNNLRTNEVALSGGYYGEQYKGHVEKNVEHETKYEIGIHNQIEGVNGQMVAGYDRFEKALVGRYGMFDYCLLYTSASPRDATLSRMPSSA